MVVTLPGKWKGMAYAIPFCVLFTMHAIAQSNDLTIEWDNSEAKGITFPFDPAKVQITAAELAQEFIVTLKSKETSIVGTYEKGQNTVSFFPIMSFTPGLSYQVKISGEVAHEFSIPYPQHLKNPVVTGIYPSSKSIPANLLKIHIYFSQPMAEGRSLDYIHVLDEKGDTLHNVFLDLKPELWNADQTGLTLWLDPGRIKRDLQPNLKWGLPFQIGSNYRIVVSSLWRDKYGVAMVNDFTKTYDVAEGDRENPNAEDWDLRYPAAKTRDALIIDFKESIDYELAIHAIRIFKDEQIYDGSIILSKSDSEWRFTPKEPWSPGSYSLLIESRLEDLAGNNMNRLFDRDLESDAENIPENLYHKVSFSIAEISMP